MSKDEIKDESSMAKTPDIAVLIDLVGKTAQTSKDNAAAIEALREDFAGSQRLFRDEMQRLRQDLVNVSTAQATSQGTRGMVHVRSVWQWVLGSTGVITIVTTLIVFVIDSKQTRLETEHAHVAEDVRQHKEEDGHQKLSGRVLALEQAVAGNHIENETQHNWIADILRLQNDWSERTRGMDLPPPRYVPLQAIGTAKSNGGLRR